MKKIMTILAFTGIAAFAGITASAQASAVNLETGIGFIGKGEVQLTLNLNNKQLQDGIPYAFAISKKTVTETTWTCDKISGEQTQERTHVERTSVQGVFNSVARVKNQITGFHLTGYSGTATITKTVDQGPAVGSCPNGWTAINLVEGQPTTTGGGITVNGKEIVAPVVVAL